MCRKGRKKERKEIKGRGEGRGENTPEKISGYGLDYSRLISYYLLINYLLFINISYWTELIGVPRASQQ